MSDRGAGDPASITPGLLGGARSRRGFRRGRCHSSGAATPITPGWNKSIAMCNGVRLPDRVIGQRSFAALSDFESVSARVVAFPDHPLHDLGSVGDDAVDTEVDSPPDVSFFVHGPEVDAVPSTVDDLDEP